jgi:uncharacterized membrane protein
LLTHRGHITTASVITILFSKVCHQDPARSFSIQGVPLPVCIRCSAIYLGILAGILVSPLLHVEVFGERRCASLMLLALAASSLEWGISMWGGLESTALTRSISGGLLGATCGICLIAVLGRRPMTGNRQVRHI